MRRARSRPAATGAPRRRLDRDRGRLAARAEATAPAVAQAPLWGFGRVLRNERRGLAAGWSTCPAGAGPGADALARTAAGRPARRGGVALRGGRRARRRLPPARPHTVRAPPAPTATAGVFRLEIGRPARWRRWRCGPRRPRAPGPGEVAIRVGAAALDFKDVLVALGVIRWPGGGGGAARRRVRRRRDGARPGRQPPDAPGERVLARRPSGSLGDAAVARAELTAPVPRPRPSRRPHAPAALATAVAALRHLARLASRASAC